MRRAYLVGAVCVADACFGDPRWLPHTVRAIGASVVFGERLARHWAHGDACRERRAGYVLCGAIVGCTYAASAATLTLVRRRNIILAGLLEAVLGWTSLAARDLLAEANAVAIALEARDLGRARERVARIVGRDTADLGASEVARAAIETLAESACDGIVAPLVALALGGVPLALAFKAASTLDSMVGHLEWPYTDLGFASARLDDVACWLPARVTALAIACCAPLVGGDASRAVSVLWADGGKHRSPNAGRPEAAMAGALGVRLGGLRRYAGLAVAAPQLGAGFESPRVADIRRAMRLVALMTGLVGAVLTIGSFGGSSRPVA